MHKIAVYAQIMARTSDTVDLLWHYKYMHESEMYLNNNNE